jgi:hypothetical protein
MMEIKKRLMRRRNAPRLLNILWTWRPPMSC